MPVPRPIVDGDLDLAEIPKPFAALAANDLGNAGSSTDGFNTRFVEVLVALPDLASLADALDAPHGEIASAFTELTTPWEFEASDALRSTIQQGQPDFDQFGVDLGILPSASGGGGSDGGPTPAPRCEVVLSIDLDAALPATVTELFINPLDRDLQITSRTFSQDIAGVFTESDDLPAAMPANTHATITITQGQPAPQGTRARLTIVSDDPDSPHVLCVVVGPAGPTPPPTPPTPPQPAGQRGKK